MSVSEVCDLLADLKGLSPSLLTTYQSRVKDNNISGLVLTMCDLADLRPVLDMKFGDWQLFRSAVSSLLEHGCSAQPDERDEIPKRETKRKVESSSGCPSGTDTSFMIPSSSRPAGEHSQSIRSFSLPERKGLPSPTAREANGIPRNELQKIRQRRMQRNDSIVQQLSYETAILKSAVSGFVEESEEDEEFEADDDVILAKEEAAAESGTALMPQSQTTQVEVHKVGKRASLDSNSPEVHQGKPVFYVGNSIGSPDKSPEADDRIKSPTMFLHSQFSYDQFSDSEGRDASQPLSSDQVSLLKSTRENSSPAGSITPVKNATLPPSSERSMQRKPMSLSDISPFIQILDGPAQSSTEFVPQLGSIQLCLAPSTSSAGSGEFIPSSTNQAHLVGTSSSLVSGSEVTSQSVSALATHSSPMSFSSDNLSSPPYSRPAYPQPPEHSESASYFADVDKVEAADNANVHVPRIHAVDKSDSESITETSPPPHKPFQSLSTSIEWLSRPLANLRQHFHSHDHHHHHQHHHPLLNESGSSSPANQHEDLVQQSYSTIVEMSAAATLDSNDGGTSNFHHRLGVAFASVDELPSSHNNSPDRETNV